MGAEKDRLFQLSCRLLGIELNRLQNTCHIGTLRTVVGINVVGTAKLATDSRMNSPFGSGNDDLEYLITAASVVGNCIG